ncbi:MAG: prepilin-type N-terminal cleavage/methylation domain-containing protein [bacterium]
MVNIFKKLKNNENGFTLMELIVVLGVFTTSALIITEIFIISNKSQRKILEYQRLQSDASYTAEVIARAVRLGSIDYESYEDAVNNPADKLFITDAAGRKIVFKKAADQDGGCVNDESSPCLISGFDMNGDSIIAADEEAAITPKGIKIDDLKFFIFPAADPYFNKTCERDEDCAAGKKQCDLVTNLCAVENHQPIVTIVFSVTQASGIEPITITLQTSVSSREYHR